MTSRARASSGNRRADTSDEQEAERPRPPPTPWNRRDQTRNANGHHSMFERGTLPRLELSPRLMSERRCSRVAALYDFLLHVLALLVFSQPLEGRISKRTTRFFCLRLALAPYRSSNPTSGKSTASPSSNLDAFPDSVAPKNARTYALSITSARPGSMGPS